MFSVKQLPVAHRKVFFVTFNDKPESDTLKRIQKEANEFYPFERIYALDRNYLFSDQVFVQKYAPFIIKNTRGYGYWIWKPYIILKILEEIPSGSFLLYADSGCSFSVSGQKRFDEYFQLLHQHQADILCFQMEHIESRWTKRDTILYMNATDKDVQSGQIHATISLWRKTAFTIDFARRWLDTVTTNNYHLVDDTPSIVPESPQFTDHRHDQSVFSLMLKKAPKIKVLADETWAWDMDSIRHVPVQATRIRD